MLCYFAGMLNSFSLAPVPYIHFGAGERYRLLSIVRQYGRKALLVTGQHSFDASQLCQKLLKALEVDCTVCRQKVSGEPSPQMIDQAVAHHKSFSPDCVVAIGGGSVIDAAKAIAGLLPSGDSVMEYLEGVGHEKPFQSISTPFIALPTTAGTGSETSKNAVISSIGNNGFKKSFRSEALIAKHAILDPELTLMCPARVTATCGMDALTQLLESYVSKKASPMTDALAISGLKKVAASLVKAVEQGDDLQARLDMLYASSMSGLTLANAGLGSVHGLASPLGGFFPIPHGEACGALLFEATNTNIRALLEREPEHEALFKYAEAGRILCNQGDMDNMAACGALLALLKGWSERLKMPSLSNYQIAEEDIPKIIANASSGSMGTNPIELKYKELQGLLYSCL